MLVFDRPSIFPSYPGISILQSTIQPPPYPLIMHNSLVAGRKTRGYIRYSLLLFPLLFCLIGRCSRRWSPGGGVARGSVLRCRVPPLTRSTLAVPRQEELDIVERSSGILRLLGSNVD